MALDDAVAGCCRLDSVDWSLATVTAARGARGGTGGNPDVADECVRWTNRGCIGGGLGGAAVKD